MAIKIAIQSILFACKNIDIKIIKNINKTRRIKNERKTKRKNEEKGMEKEAGK